MTKLNPEIFNYLKKQGTNLDLITRLEILINSSDSLEAFRIASIDGSIPIIRIASPGELDPQASAQFIRNSDTTPHTILINASLILNYPSTSTNRELTILGELSHEFSHYQRFAQRNDFEGDLANQTIEAAKRANTYIKAALDDESRSRQDALTAMREAAAKYPEYAGYLRMKEITDPVFSGIVAAEKRATELRLTGKERSDFILDNVRNITADDKVGTYLSRFTKYAADVLGLDADTLLAERKKFLGINNETSYRITERPFDDGSVQFQFHYSDGKSILDTFDSSGTRVAHIEYFQNTLKYSWTQVGNELKQYHYNATGELTSSSISRLNAAGQPVSERFFDADGKLTRVVLKYYANGKLNAERWRDSAGRQTNYRLIDVGSGLVLQDRKFDPATGKQYQNLSYRDGKLVGIMDFRDGKSYRYTSVNAATGSPVQTREWNPETGIRIATYDYTNGKLTSERLFDSNGKQTNYRLIDANTGAVTQDRVFDPATGRQTQFLAYRDGKLVGRGDFVEGRQYGYTSLDSLTGLPIETREWNTQTGKRTITRYYTDGRLTADRLFDDSGRQTNYRLMDSTGKQVAEDRQFNPATGQHTKTSLYEGGTLVGDASFSNGRQTRYRRFNPQNGQPERILDYDYNSGKVVSRAEISNGRLSQATYDSTGKWEGTRVHENADPSSPVVTRYWLDGNGRLHRWWMNPNGHTGESTYNGATVSSGLRWSNFTDPGGYRHEQDYTGRAYTDTVYYPDGRYYFRALQDPARPQIVIVFPNLRMAVTSGTIGDAANAAASLSGGSGIVNPIVPYTPIVAGATPLTGLQPGAKPTVLTPGSFGYVTTMVYPTNDKSPRVYWGPMTILEVGGRPILPIARLVEAPATEAVSPMAATPQLEANMATQSASALDLRVQHLISAMAAFDTPGAISPLSSQPTTQEETTLAAAA